MEEDKITLDLYCRDTKSLASSSHRTLRRLSVIDSVLDFIITQRERLGLETEATKFPDGSEAANYRETMMATSAPVTGIKDLQQLSKRLASVQKEPGREKCAAIANEFVYALRRDVAGNFNPYDLHIVSSERARIHESYYTISAFNVSEVRASDLASQKSKAELKLTAGHWLFSVHILPNGQPFPKVVGRYGQPYTCTHDDVTIPLNAFADMLASLHELCGFWSYLNNGIHFYYAFNEQHNIYLWPPNLIRWPTKS